MLDNRRIKKICVLGAAFSTNNMGVSVLTAGTIKSLLHQFPCAEIVLLNYGKERVLYHFQIGDKSVPIQLLNMRFSKKVYLRNNIIMLILLSIILKFIPFETLRGRIITKNFYLNHIFQSDIVASVSGGDSFSDIYGIRNFFYNSLPQLLVLFMKKDLILIPQTLGPYKGRMVRVMARYILTHARIVYSRDYSGLEEIKDWLGNGYRSDKMRFCYDVGFVLDAKKPEGNDSVGVIERICGSSVVVGLNVSGLLFNGDYEKNNKFGLKVNYIELIFDIIKVLIEEEKAAVMLVPHVLGSEELSESDLVACRRVYNAVKDKYDGKIFIVEEISDEKEMKFVIGLCNVFIGSRMHACIAALSQNVPAVGIAYSKKFVGVMQSIGLESLVADARKKGKEEIICSIVEAYKSRDLIRRYLAQKVPEIRERVLNLFKDI